MAQSTVVTTTTKTNWLKTIIRQLFSALTIGIVLGLFRMLIFNPSYLFQLDSNFLFLILAVLILILAQLTIHRLSILRGSGVPQVRSFVTLRRSLKPFTYGSIKFTLVVLLNSIGFSIGSAGPSVFLGVCAGGLVSGVKTQEDGLVSAFGGAGLAAFFSAPLSGLMLSLEELGLKRSLPSLLQAVMIILSAWLTSYIITGRQLGLLNSTFSFNITTMHVMTLIVIAITSTAAGHVFKRLLLKSTFLVTSQFKMVFLFLMPLLFLLLARRYPEISGGGILLLKTLSTVGTFTASMIFLFVLLKFCFTLSCVITNIPAGLFMPSLSIGGAIGSFIYVASQSLIPSAGLSATVFIACGASCFFFSLMRRPLLSAFIAAELFGDYRLLLVLLPIVFAVHLVLSKSHDRPLNDTLYDLVDLID